MFLRLISNHPFQKFIYYKLASAGALPKIEQIDNIFRTPRYSKGGIQMRESIIKRILALTDEQFELLIALLEEAEESEEPHRQSA